MSLLDDLLDRGRLPDAVIRAGIRRLLGRRLRHEERDGVEAMNERRRALIEASRMGPVAVHTQAANDQHYEVPAEFFVLSLGPRLKYSSALWSPGIENLGAAEVAMLELSCERARLADGQRILELGCGWGSMTLYMAARHPQAKITAVSNSAGQRRFILDRAARQGITNVDVLTADMNEFTPAGCFDRVVSIEMFEHMTNHAELMRRVATWLEPEGLCFLHVFAHRIHAYPFVVDGDDDWMARHFFTGGMMPSFDWLPRFQEHLTLVDDWTVSGRHYAKTAEAWLRNLDANRSAATTALETVHGASANVWFNRWRVFFMACAELWDYASGNEWAVKHHLFRKR